jgi:hypothetical protein
METSAQVNAVAAMFANPKMTNADRNERVEVVKTAGRSAAGLQITPAQTRIMLPTSAVGAAWMNAIANAFNVDAKQLASGAVEGDWEVNPAPESTGETDRHDADDAQE